MAQYRTAIAAEPSNAKPHVNLGNLLSELGKYPEAIV